MAVTLKAVSVTFQFWLALYALNLFLAHTATSLYVNSFMLLIIIICLVKMSIADYDPAVADNLLGPATLPSKWDDVDVTKSKSDFSEKSSCFSAWSYKNLPVVAHRTLPFHAPENSLAGIKEAKKRNAWAVEFDVRLSGDGVPVLMHDSYLDRIVDDSQADQCKTVGGTGESSKETNGLALVSQMTFDQLKGVVINSRHLFSDSFKQETVPKLDDAIDLCLSLDVKMFINFKTNDIRAVNYITDKFRAKPELQQKAVILSHNPVFLYHIRKLSPSIVTALLWRRWCLSVENATGYYDSTPSASESINQKYASTWWKQIVAYFADIVLEIGVHTGAVTDICGCAGLIVHKDSFSPEFVRKWRRQSIRLLAWPVNDHTEKDYFSRILQVPYLTDTIKASQCHLMTPEDNMSQPGDGQPQEQIASDAEPEESVLSEMHLPEVNAERSRTPPPQQQTISPPQTQFTQQPRESNESLPRAGTPSRASLPANKQSPFVFGSQPPHHSTILNATNGAYPEDQASYVINSQAKADETSDWSQSDTDYASEPSYNRPEKREVGGEPDFGVPYSHFGKKDSSPTRYAHQEAAMAKPFDSNTGQSFFVSPTGQRVPSPVPRRKYVVFGGEVD